MYPSTAPSVKPPQCLPRRERTVNTALAQTHSIWLCHCDAEFYNQRSLLLLQYSCVFFLEEQLRCVFHTGSIFFSSSFSSASLGKTRHQLVLNGHNNAALHTSTRIAFCVWHCCFTSGREPGPRLSMRKGLCGAEGVRSDSAAHSLTHLMRLESWQLLVKP